MRGNLADLYPVRKPLSKWPLRSWSSLLHFRRTMPTAFSKRPAGAARRSDVARQTGRHTTGSRAMPLAKSQNLIVDQASFAQPCRHKRHCVVGAIGDLPQRFCVSNDRVIQFYAVS